MELLSASKTPIAITMSLFQLVSFLFVLGIFLTISPAEADDPIFLRENCTSNETFAANSAFQFNLKTFLTTLSSKATGTTEFYNTTVAGTNPSDTVYGLFMCRGDVPPDLCQECVMNATQRLENSSSLVCPFGKGAIIWYDECFVRYSNRNFFSTVDTRPRMRLRNTENVTNPEPYNRLLYLTLNATADEAAKAPIGAKKYATKEANISAFQTLYTLTQCTPDLSPQDCRSCLNEVITDLAWCCLNRIGGRVLYPSCNFRYELYPFYRSEEAAPGPTSAGLVPPGTSAYHKEKNGISPGTIIAIVVPITVAVLLFIVGICFLNKRTRTKHDSVQEGKDGTDLTTLESLQFDFRTIDEATDHFSTSNKLGEGGFGEVYKGRLSKGQEIAVKRLSKSSGQGAEEFKNEMVLVAKLQHRHLVRLLGFCLQGEEKILIYEFVPNKSLDYVLFDPERQTELDWTRRYNIIQGIVRGIEYLHVDSRLRIIHRDLKSSNILLDGDMNPKISDFGMARIFGGDQTQGNTSRIVGTYGYMPPEYAMHGDFSIKSDVYSFGVLLMEIISGKKNSSFYQSDGAEDLLNYAWKLWKDGTPMEMLDPTVRESCNPNEVIRCIHIGLLCVQEDPADRPTTQTILLMLESFSVTLPAPKEPAFFLHSGTKPNMPIKGLQHDQSTTNSVPMSVNEMSISGIYPR